MMMMMMMHDKEEREEYRYSFLASAIWPRSA